MSTSVQPSEWEQLRKVQEFKYQHTICDVENCIRMARYLCAIPDNRAIAMCSEHLAEANRKAMKVVK